MIEIVLLLQLAASAQPHNFLLSEFIFKSCHPSSESDLVNTLLREENSTTMTYWCYCQRFVTAFGMTCRPYLWWPQISEVNPRCRQV